jgi:hypothetical protein
VELIQGAQGGRSVVVWKTGKTHSSDEAVATSVSVDLAEGDWKVGSANYGLWDGRSHPCDFSLQLHRAD